MRDEPGQLLRQRPDAPHARVELQVGVRGDASLARRRGELIEHVRPVDQRREPVLQQQSVIRVLPAQNENRRGDAQVAQREPLLDQRHAQPVGARLEERLGRDGGAVAVAIRLHDAHHPAAGRGPARLAEVVAQRVCVDARLGGPDAQIEGPTGGIAKGGGGGLGHLGLPA